MPVNKARRVGRPRRASANPAQAAPAPHFEAPAGPERPSLAAMSDTAAPQAAIAETPVQRAPSAAADDGSAVPKARRRRRGDVGGHKLKLSAPQRAGFVRRWVNDDPGRIPDLQELAYDFVEEKVSGDGLGTRISRVVGRDADGKPKHAYLMETPSEEYAQGQADKEAGLRQFDDAIRAQRDTTGRMTDAYEPRDRSSLTNTT